MTDSPSSTRRYVLGYLVQVAFISPAASGKRKEAAKSEQVAKFFQNYYLKPQSCRKTTQR